MSSPSGRIRRLVRIEALIQRKLDREAAALAAAQEQLRNTQAAIETLTTRVLDARQQGHNRLIKGADAEQWKLEHDWQQSLGAELQGMQRQLVVRRETVDSARARVLVAHEDMQKMETLLKRLRSSQRTEDNRQQRKVEDDAYAALAATARKSEEV